MEGQLSNEVKDLVNILFERVRKIELILAFIAGMQFITTGSAVFALIIR